MHNQVKRAGLVAILLIFSVNVNAQFLKKLLAPDTAKVPKKHRVLALPVISRSPETDWAFGFAGTWLFKTDIKDSTVRTSNVQLVALYTLRQQFVAQVDANIVFPGEKYYLKIHTSTARFPDRLWGVGNNMPESNEEKFTYAQYHINPTLMRKIKPRLFAGLIYDFQHFYYMDFIPGGIIDQQKLPGRFKSIVSGPGAMLLFDSRDNLYNAYKGWYVQLSSIFYNKVFGSQYNYGQYILDVRKYIRLYKSHVLAFQWYTEFNGPGDVPFRNMARMGGPERMRGYYSGRFTDKAHTCYQAEYRFPIVWRIGGTLFGALGQVAPSIGKFAMNGFKYTYGLGLRVAANRRERINLRFDYGLRKGGGDYYFIIAEAF